MVHAPAAPSPPPSPTPPAAAPPTPRTRLRRLPARGTHERQAIEAILDEGLVCHVGFVEQGSPFVVPTGYARDGDRLLLHGSKASRLMQVLASGAEVCVTVTLLDGMVLARSAFHHSMNYRSVVVFGRARPLDGPAKDAALLAYVERMLPGRWDGLRPVNATEREATLVVELPFPEASAKVRTGPPKDDADDAGFPVWAGIVPLRLAPGAPVQDPAQAVLPVPSGVASWRPERRRG